MKTNFYNIIDSLKFSLGDEKWDKLTKETMGIYHTLNKDVSGASFVERLDDSQAFQELNVPHCMTALIAECFRDALQNMDVTKHIYGFNRLADFN